MPSDQMFDPRTEMPALLERIGGLAIEFRDVFEGNASANHLQPEARELRAACLRLNDVVFALTATALVNLLGG